MAKNVKVPFPQADDLGKVISLVNISNIEKLKDEKYLSNLLGGITNRQLSYYTSACIYLGFFTRTKKLTEEGEKFRMMNSSQQEIELIRVLLADEILGTLFITEKVFETEITKHDIIAKISEYYPEYSEVIYNRRSQTVSSWLKWLHNCF